MSSAPSCSDSEDLQGTAQCGRHVASYWNPASGQRREKCGPAGLFFEPRDTPIRGRSGAVIIDEAAHFARARDTVADSDGDDGA